MRAEPAPATNAGRSSTFTAAKLPSPAPLWGQADHLIASSQLAKRKDRRDEVLKPEWDLVLVDEAHHARRREFGTRVRRPNHLLQLLADHGKLPGLKDRTRCLYLLTATPMQVDPVEVWDLLKLLGLEEFPAARASLGRRREFLMDPDAKVSGALADENLEQDDLGLDAAEDMAAPDADARRIKLKYLDDFIGELEAFTVDSKLEFLKDQLRRIFQARDSAILFTQYTDTMDYLRDSFRAVYGSGVACYSGRGGESWDGEHWILRSKESIK